MLPTQPSEIKSSVSIITLTSAQIIEIKKVSPHVRLINKRVREQIEARYSMQDELKLLRLAPSPETTAYNDYAESCRADGRAEKAAIGL